MLRLKTRFQQKANRISRLFSPVLYLRQLADYGGSFYNQKKDFRRDQRLAGPQAQRRREGARERVRKRSVSRTHARHVLAALLPSLGLFPHSPPWLFPAVSLFSIAQLNLLCLWSPIYSGPTASVCRMRCSQCGSGFDEYDSCRQPRTEHCWRVHWATCK